MEIIKIQGGLGNQLFQYTYGKYLKREGKKIAYNIKWFDSHGKERGQEYVLPQIITRKKIPIVDQRPTISAYGQDLIYTEPMREKIISEMDKIKLRDSFFIHVRRGDYLNHPKYVYLDFDYYDRAYNLITQIRGGGEVFIFSNDIAWCRKNFKYPNMVFIDKSTVESFNLMRSCRYKIIANSTFSWWAAYSSGGEVVAPSKWFTNREFNIIPKGWIKV